MSDLDQALEVVRAAKAAHYVSTYCIHDDHKHCRRTCKTCDAPCLCPCHRIVVDDPHG